VIKVFKPFEKSHLHMARHLTGIIFHALQNDQNTSSEIYNYFFADLLKGKYLKKLFIR